MAFRGCLNSVCSGWAVCIFLAALAFTVMEIHCLLHRLTILLRIIIIYRSLEINIAVCDRKSPEQNVKERTYYGLTSQANSITASRGRTQSVIRNLQGQDHNFRKQLGNYMPQ